MIREIKLNALIIVTSFAFSSCKTELVSSIGYEVAIILVFLALVLIPIAILTGVELFNYLRNEKKRNKVVDDVDVF